ncbi:hypothetical protein OIU79_021509 [Salix purpurea]|uniref:Reverse transcriptase zinc-binding domain-containing protein n=1 Tax=Salix purpurea TaxID=77065 RepID=A0A9Q0NR13_SALPP|nr:hypothetical protein OIU79_021509 [Salix purpurea]
MLWLAARGRLNTADRVHGEICTRCVLCNEDEETHGHLFFNCSFTAGIWAVTGRRAQVRWPANDQDIFHWASLNLQGILDAKHIIAKLILSSTVYFVWYERNNRIFKHQFTPREQIQKDIIGLVRDRLSTILTSKIHFSSIIRDDWGLTGEEARVIGPAQA